MVREKVRKFLCRLAIIVMVGVVLLVGAGWALTTERVQQWMFGKAMTMLSKHFNTRVEADSLSVNPWKGDISLYGFAMDDLKKVEMLHVDTLKVKLSMTDLLRQKVVVKKLKLSDATAVLYKEHKDSAANYQFVSDSFKKKKEGSKKRKTKNNISLDLKEISISNVHVKWDVRDKKRKNEGRPNRGAFDANHLDATLNMTASLKSVKKDSLHANIEHLSIDDAASGLKVSKLTTTADFGKRGITLKDTHIALQKTKLTLGTVKAAYRTTPADTIKGTKRKTEMWLEPFGVEGDVYLQDIAAPFAPVLSHFSTPLQLSVSVDGTLDRIGFNDIKVTSMDKRLQLTAKGDLCNVAKGSKALCLHFNNISLSARNGIKEQIINHFSKNIKLKMIRQMRAIGDVRFNGRMGIFYKKETFKGTLKTKFGNVNVNFVLDGKTHYMRGSLNTPSLEVGKLMNVPKVGAVGFSADYEFNIASKRYAHDENVKNGRLPQGWINASVTNAKYGILHLKRVDVNAVSNGSVATGMVFVPQKPLSIALDFVYTQTIEEQSIKVKVKAKKGKKDKKS